MKKNTAGITPADELLLGIIHFTHYTFIIELQQQKLIFVPEYGYKKIETAIDNA
ncbi:hypothetical protein BN133_1625 [Cronobacter dublinensis 582]|nr:hypothetical protein BN133_1625 [Cronobacter dublinensis 582]